MRLVILCVFVFICVGTCAFSVIVHNCVNQDTPLPLLSAGVGRTGAYITIDAMMQQMKEKDDLNIYEFVTQMRTKRTFMVQNQVHIMLKFLRIL